MPSLFHHSPYRYEPGDVIPRSGRRNRILELKKNDPVRLREERFERIRLREFPEAVSRLDCNWVYEELTPALKGMSDGNPDPTPYLYGVDLIDAGSRCHRGALDILNSAWALAFSSGEQARDELIRQYWRGLGVGPGGIELLIDGDLKVAEVLQVSCTLPQVDLEELFSIETDDH